MSNSKKRGLGRGLSALMADVADAESASVSGEGVAVGATSVPIEKIEPNPDQPRRTFLEEELSDLTNSIRQKGVIQPLIVRPMGSGFQIVAGERRWRAAQAAQLHELPVVIRDFDDSEVLEIAIVENIQRADLNPIEEAMGFRQLMDKFGHTQEKLAEALGKSRSHIANVLRLLQLPDKVISMIQAGDLSAGHARALITSKDPVKLAYEVVKKGLSVRDTERLAKKKSQDDPLSKSTVKTPNEKDADTRALENDLMAAIGMKVTLTHTPGKEDGKLTLHYKSLEQLDDICRKLSSD